MEGQSSIKSEPDWPSHTDELSNIESSEQLPSDNLQDEPGDIFEIERIDVKEEHHIQDDTDLGGDITFDEVSIPVIKIETPSTVSNGDLNEDVNEETQDDESDASRHHPDELMCPDTSNPAVRKKYALSNTGGGHNTSTLSGKTFTIHQNLKTNEPIHSGRKTYSCRMCDYKINWPSLMKRHMLTHSGEKPYSCSTCSAKFSQRGHLKAHMLTHTGEKPHLCTTCEGKFVRKEELKKHMFTHTGQKPYSCSICEATFLYRNVLKRHMLTHSGKKPYSCSICKAKFARKDHVKKHTLIHSGTK